MKTMYGTLTELNGDTETHLNLQDGQANLMVRVNSTKVFGQRVGSENSQWWQFTEPNCIALCLISGNPRKGGHVHLSIRHIQGPNIVIEKLLVTIPSTRIYGSAVYFHASYEFNPTRGRKTIFDALANSIPPERRIKTT